MADRERGAVTAGGPLVREARPADGGEMTGLLGELGYPTDAATFADRYQRLRDDRATWVFVAELDHRVVGFASLHVILLRTYRIPRPVTVKVRDEYGGCRSWLELTRELPFEGTPVLSDDEFERASEEIAAIASDRQPVLV